MILQTTLSPGLRRSIAFFLHPSVRDNMHVT